MALAPSIRWLFVGRVISGITAASISTAYAYVADVTPPDKRAARFGLLGAAFGAGFVLGPALGGLAGSISPRLPFWIAAGLSLANAAYGLFVLPELLPRSQCGPRFAWQRANPLGASRRCYVRTPNLFGLAGVNFLDNLAHAVLPSVSVLYMSYRYGWNERDRRLDSWRGSVSHRSSCRAPLSARSRRALASEPLFCLGLRSVSRALRCSRWPRLARSSGSASRCSRCGGSRVPLCRP